MIKELTYGTDPQADAQCPHDWREPLTGHCGRCGECVAAAAYPASLYDYGEQGPDTDGLALFPASLRQWGAKAWLRAYLETTATPSPTAAALPARALNPLPHPGGLFCIF